MSNTHVNVQEYDARLSSAVMSGEVRLTVGPDGLLAATLFDVAEIPYAEMIQLSLDEYTVNIRTFPTDYAFSRMGRSAKPFYEALLKAYNKKVRRSLFVAGNPVLESAGAYEFTENGQTCRGTGTLQVYPDCICILPPDLNARRIPLCFLGGMEEGGYELTFQLPPAANYTLRKLGRNTQPFAEAVKTQLIKLREDTLNTVKELDPSLNMAQARSIAGLLPAGAAAGIRQLTEAAPGFIEAAENIIGDSRIRETYQAFKELGDAAQMYLGLKRITAGAETDAGQDQYMIWLAVPSPDGSMCAVEFAGTGGDAAATFLYRCEGEFASFIIQLNRALEAISFRREIIRLSEDELMRTEYQEYRMAVQRNRSLKFVRGCFAGRIIHSGAQTWRQALADAWQS